MGAVCVLLIRVWAAGMVTPFERAIHGARPVRWTRPWNDYLDLRHIRDENKQLKADRVDRLRLEQAMLHEDAIQGQRPQGLLELSRELHARHHAGAGDRDQRQQPVACDLAGQGARMMAWRRIMPWLPPDGIVGKVREVFKKTAQVLEINDQTSGAGVVLETTRICGLLRGNAAWPAAGGEYPDRFADSAGGKGTDRGWGPDLSARAAGGFGGARSRTAIRSGAGLSTWWSSRRRTCSIWTKCW